MVSYSFYESDNRVMRYAEALVNRGDEVDVVALRRPGHAPFENMDGVRVFRVQERRRDERGPLSHLKRLIEFFLRSGVFMAMRGGRMRYDVIHVHSVPDFEVFATVMAKWLGAKIILDIHDIVPELYRSKFGRGNSSFAFRMLLLVERLSTRYADHVIISNHLWRKKLLGRSVPERKCTAILNYPDSSLFFPGEPRDPDGRFVFMYPGTLNWHQGLDVAIRALARIRDEVPQAVLEIYGEGETAGHLLAMTREMGLEDRVLVREPVPIKQIACVMAGADFGLVPKRDSQFGGEAFSTKILEFMALGVPVIASDTKIDRYYFNDSVVKFFRSGDEEDLAESMLLLIRDSELGKRLASNALEFVQDYTWDKKKHEYFDLVDSLVYGQGQKT
jgi:glycosyltransferase involved in cell wall biosynthesis